MTSYTVIPAVRRDLRAPDHRTAYARNRWPAKTASGRGVEEVRAALAALEFREENRAAPLPESRGTDAVSTEFLPPGFVQAGSIDARIAIHHFRRFDVIGGRFRILRFIDRGGMGEVYEAENLAFRSKPRLALKIIRPEISTNLRALARFERELGISSMLRHTNLCRIYGFGVHRSPHSCGAAAEIPFLVMELLRGRTLAARLGADGPFTTRESLPLVTQIADALSAVHGASIIHRDLKPGNIMLVPMPHQRFPRAVLIDFGLAKQFAATAEQENDPAEGGADGTPDYMSPEQVLGGALDASSDIYSFGVLMYQMVTGTLPFDGPNAVLRMRQRLREVPVPPRRRVPMLDLIWETVIMKCLRIDPGQRFTSSREVLTALEGAQYSRAGTLPCTSPAASMRARTSPLSAVPGQAQSRPNDLAAILAKPLETPDVVGAGNLPWL